VAIKLIEPALLSPASDKRREVTVRFLIEAQAAATLRSPHVVQILDYGVERDVPYIAMELLEGQTLAERIAEVGVLPYVETARVVTHVARALSKAHEAGIVHRDLKPDNVFLTGADDEQVAKVLDFGIAKTAASLAEPPPGQPAPSGPIALTRIGSMLGTPAYMSPEQMMGHLPVDWRSDLWALAVIAFECVVGRRPFHADTPLALAVEVCSAALPVPSRITAVPPGFDAWFACASARDPAERFQTAKQLADSLRKLLEQPGLVPPASARVPSLPAMTDATTHLRTSRTPAQLMAVARRGSRRRVAVGLVGFGLVSALLLSAVAWRRESSTAAATGAQGLALSPSIEKEAPGASEPPRPNGSGEGAGPTVEPAPARDEARPKPPPRASAPRAAPARSGRPSNDDPRLGF
jgi:serine/threonine-protein kinase